MVETEADFFGGMGSATPVGAEIDRRQITAHLIRPIATIIRITQPELTQIIEPPTFHTAIVEDGTGMI